MILIIKICAVVLLTVCAVLFVRSNNKEFSFAVELSGAALVLSLIVSSVSDVVNQLSEWMNNYGEMHVYFTLSLKAFCVVTLTHFIAELCKDSGNGLLATCVEFAGRVSVVGMALPLIKAVVLSTAEMLSQ